MKYKHIVFDIDGTLIDTEYAVFVEFGTSNMAAQPYLVPALLSNTQAILSAIAEAIKG